MPLDDIFHEKNTAPNAKHLKHFWQKCAIFIGCILWLFLIGRTFLKYGSIDISNIIGTLFGIIVIPTLLAYFLALFASYIPYRGLLPEDRIDIYFYIFVTTGLSLYLLGCIDYTYNNSLISDSLYSFFFG